MRDRWRRHPQLESLESKALPSSLSAGVHHVHKPSATAAAPLVGTASGTFFAHQGNSRSGTVDSLFASGEIAPGGPALLVGGIQARGFAANGAGGGNLVLAFKSGPGNLFLRLTETAAPAPGEYQFRYKAPNGAGSGTLTITLRPINTNIHGQLATNPGFFGKATLTFRPGA